MLRAFVPSFSQENVSGKQFTVYKIVVLQSSKRHEIERRYSAFHALHKQLKGMHPTPYFPPKRVRNFSPKFLEQRRQGLEHYLQGALTIRPVPQPLLNFLNLSSLSPAVSFTSLDAEEIDLTINHQPVLTFGKNSFVEIKRGNLPDIISQGVLHGLYSNEKLTHFESQDN